jgi:dipeptidyl aminopeptidase/acylaminoacyl peptidase
VVSRFRIFTGGEIQQQRYQYQFFATRGYAVFSPNPRGTPSRGRKHLVPATENLLLLMQDDIADGVKSLIKDGTADAGKVFLYGEYYGGHIAILSSLRYPELYKGVVIKNAILDLTEHYEKVEDDKYPADMDYLHTILNTRKPSGKLLEQYSPQHLIKDIKTPLLVFHGKNNNVVEVKRAENFRDTAVKIDNKNITVTLIDKEGYANWDSSNDIYFFEKSLQFLEKSGAAKLLEEQGGTGGAAPQ